jgi:hypothetical protein
MLTVFPAIASVYPMEPAPSSPPYTLSKSEKLSCFGASPAPKLKDIPGIVWFGLTWLLGMLCVTVYLTLF